MQNAKRLVGALQDLEKDQRDGDLKLHVAIVHGDR
jgi:hypothetical protein